jgi:hypothetical protein
VYGVSADGLTIVGAGLHNDRLEGWVATLGTRCYPNCDGSTAAPVLGRGRSPVLREPVRRGGSVREL